MSVFKFRLPRIGKHASEHDAVRHQAEESAKGSAKPRHLEPPKCAPKPVSELSSSVLRALEKVAPGAPIEEIRRLLLEHKPILAAEFDRIVASGRRKPVEALRSIQLKEAADMLGALHELGQLAAARKAGALLPVPPHIADHVLYCFDEDLVFSTEDHLPPHLARIGYDMIDDLLPDDVVARFVGIEALLLEGFVRKGSLLVRKSAVAAIQMLGNKDLRLFVHRMPHMPHHVEFETVAGEYSVTELL